MMFKQVKRILLASGSPRRHEYLSRYGLKFRVLTGDLEEKAFGGERPKDFTLRMALEKNKAVHCLADEDEIVISADTIVVIEDQIIGKPTSREHKLEILNRLNGEAHEVLTAYGVYDCQRDNYFSGFSRTKVLFQKMPREWIKAYADQDESDDKAGGYSIQGMGTFLVKSITGSFNNVVGFPIEKLLFDLHSKDYIQIEDKG
ncbi:MAG: Maf family protein [Deltaproteobacteria bacterium]|nr:Maf family protein [Deltaproteobacteria bacterium]